VAEETTAELELGEIPTPVAELKYITVELELGIKPVPVALPMEPEDTTILELAEDFIVVAVLDADDRVIEPVAARVVFEVMPVPVAPDAEPVTVTVTVTGGGYPPVEFQCP